MTDNLVKWLREETEWTNQKPYFHAHTKCLEAADRIEALTAENERLEKEVAQAWCDDAMPCRQLLDAKQDNERLNHVNQELQSENARMRDALKPFAELGFPYACEALGGNDE